MKRRYISEVRPLDGFGLQVDFVSGSRLRLNEVNQNEDGDLIYSSGDVLTYLGLSIAE